MSDTLQVEARTGHGSRHARKLRAEGTLPIVLYGHGKETLSLQVPARQVRDVLKHGGKVVQLEGASSEQALLQSLQWDTFGQYLMHVDLLRVRKGEKVHVEVAVEMKGEAPGEREGGIVTLLLHSIEVEAPPRAIPERLHVDVSELHINDSIPVSAIFDLPEGATFVTDEEEVLVSCNPPKVVEEPEDATTEAAGEPELVGGEKSEDADDGGEKAED